MNNPFLDPNYPFDQQSTDYKKLSKWFFESKITDYQKMLNNTTEKKWQSLGQTKALNLFHQAAQHIPAYKKFLKTHQIDHLKIKTAKDFRQVPPTDKPSYFLKYPLEEFSWYGKLANANTISFSSGSTGKPYFWPRTTYQDYEGAFAFEHLLTSLFHIEKKSTLLVNCFSMGNYVAGVYVYTSTHALAQKGYPLTIVSPGINYQDTFNILKKIIHKYDQIILCGYPPFIRDLIELGLEYEINWSKHSIKFFFASEFFSENWRDNTLEQAGVSRPLSNSTNIYGTADSAIFAFETPISILIRKLAQANSNLHKSLFGSQTTPTFVQYNPLLTFFEQIDSEIAITSNSGLPLIRYNLKDQGGIISNQTLIQTLKSHNINLNQQLSKNNLLEAPSQLPHLYITNRSDGAVSFYAILIYPEYIRTGLETKELLGNISGKFTLRSGHNQANQPTLEIHVELRAGITPSLKLTTLIKKSVVAGLKARSAEYSFLEKSIKEKALPVIILHQKGSSEYFKIGIKQKWTIK